MEIAKKHPESELPDIIFKQDKTCLLTNYRTGSTYFIRQTFHKNKISPTLNWEHFNSNKSFDHSLHEITIPEQVVFKLMPDHIERDMKKLDEIVKVCNNPIYLYRRDFEAQARSWIAWNISGDHEHHWGEMRNYNVTVSQDVADIYIMQLLRNYEFMKEAYKKYPGAIHCLEDFPNKRPYARQYTWQSDIKIPQFNVTKEVFRN